MGLPDRKKLRM